jgi:hypothetical protein
MDEEPPTDILPQHPTSTIDVERIQGGKIRCTDGRFAPEFREHTHTPREWEEILERHILCLECDESFINFLWGKGAACWRCKAAYHLVDDSHGAGVYAVLAKLFGQDDDEARYIISETLDGWALVDWAGLENLEDEALPDRFWGV